MEIIEPEWSREIVTRAAENEVFLSFNDDIDGELFLEWFTEAGWKEFKAWGEKEKEKRLQS